MDEVENDVGHISHTVQFRVSCTDYGEVIVTAQTVPRICPPPSSQIIQFCKDEFSHLSNLELADDLFCNPSNGDKIDILIGLDYYWTFVTDEVRRGENGPVATNSIYYHIFKRR